MTKKRTVKPSSIGALYTRIVNQPHGRLDDFIPSNSDPAHKFALRRKWRRTSAERKFEQMLRSVGNGALIGKFETEWAICGKWILDFYFPQYRLAVEIDGEYHNEPEQKERDKAKSVDCEKLEITLLRLTNQEVLNLPTETERKLLQYLEVAAARAEGCTKIEPLCDIRLTKRERELIQRHFKFYQSLATGELHPTTAKQEHFVAVLKGDAQPQTKHEIAFAKFLLMISSLYDNDPET